MDTENPKAAIEYIHSLGRFSGKPGLHRIKALCEAQIELANQLPKATETFPVFSDYAADAYDAVAAAASDRQISAGV